MKFIHPIPAQRNSRNTLAASNSDDFSDFYFLQYFLAKLSHPDRQFRGKAPTLLLT